MKLIVKGDFIIQCDCGSIEWYWGNKTSKEIAGDASEVYFKFPTYPQCNDCERVIPKDLLRKKWIAQTLKTL